MTFDVFLIILRRRRAREKDMKEKNEPWFNYNYTMEFA
jgi:hypothetical protein